MTAPEFRDPQTQRIYQRLLQIGQGAAAFFADAYRLVEEVHPFQTRTHLIGHLLRELESSVRDVLAAATAAPPKKRCEEGYGAKTIEHIVDNLGFDQDGPLAAGWKGLTLHRLAHRSNLDPPRDPGDSERTWLTMIEVLDGLLDRFEARYADTYRRLDRLIHLEQPTKEAARELKNTIPQTPPTLNYFFSRLTNPQWFPCLASWTVVCQAPPPVLNEDADTVQFPMWPAAQYLGRVASIFPDPVADILGGLETENVRAQSQAVDIALLLPIEFSEKLVHQISSWIPLILRYQFPCEALFNLIIRLADGGHPASALALLDEVLAPPKEKDAQEQASWLHSEDVPYDLESKAEEVFDALVGGDSQATIDLLARQLECRLLVDPITGGAADGEEPGIPDYSTTWLPNLRSKAPRYRGSMRPFLASHLRRTLDAAVADIGSNPIVERLRARQTMLFRRIELDFLARHVEEAFARAAERLMDRAVFETSDLRAEYADLFAAGFPMLSTRNQERLLGWIDEGLDHWNESDSGEVDTWRMVWKRDWLALVEPHLNDERRQSLRQLIVETGPPQPFYRTQSMAHFVGPDSPVGEDELKAMDIDAILALLRDWEPSGAPDSSSRAGLGQVLSATIADDPQRFAADAATYIDLHPPYKQAILSGLSRGFRDGRQFDWGPVLNLTQSLTAEAIEKDSIANAEADGLSIWNAVKRSIVDLLNLGLSLGERGMSVDLAEQVWSQIVWLADDDDPTRQREDRWIDQDSNPASLALNSVRPRVISAAIRLAFWKNHAAEQDHPTGFKALPEVAKLLQKHMDPDQERSMAVRSVFGQELYRLIWFDREWVKSNEELLFPKAPVREPQRAVVFEAHLRYGRLHDSLLPVLADEYKAAIRRTTPSDEELSPHAPERKLAQHLMLLYARGQLELEHGLLPLFFSEAPATVRKEALHFLAWWLNRLEEADGVEPRVAERLLDLWDWRAAALERTLEEEDSPRARSELMEFGWWFASGALETPWSFSRLWRVLELCGRTAWDRQVARRLAYLVDEYPADVLSTLKLVNPLGEGELAYPLHWRGHAHTIFAATVHHEVAAISQDATELINRWIAQGYPDLRDLLSRTQE